MKKHKIGQGRNPAKELCKMLHILVMAEICIRFNFRMSLSWRLEACFEEQITDDNGKVKYNIQLEETSGVSRKEFWLKMCAVA